MDSHGWIRVEDELPEEGERVLIWTATGPCVAVRSDSLKDVKPQWHLIFGKWIKCSEVAHWMRIEGPSDG